MFAHPIPNITELIQSNNGQCPYKTWTIDTVEPDVHKDDIVEKCGYIVTWTNEHKVLKQIQPLRIRGDPLIDNLLNCVSVSHNESTWIQWIQQQHKSIDTKYNAEQKDAISALLTHIHTVPDWVDYDRVKRGQSVFLRYCMPCLMSLFNLSLIGGVSAPKINAVLVSTNYLSSTDTYAVYRRLMETTVYVVQLLQINSLHINSIGWQNNVSVRFLHGQVRSRLMKRAGDKAWDIDTNGIPINQADSATTLLAFSINVLLGLAKVGINLSESEKEDYIHLWRVCGYYLGVDDDVNPCTSYHDAEIAIGSYVMTSVQPDYSDTTPLLANTMIDAIQKHHKVLSHAAARAPPIFHIYLARYMLGDYFADTLKLPSSTVTIQQHGILLYLQYIRIKCMIPIMFMVFKLYGWIGSFELFHDTICDYSLQYLLHWCELHLAVDQQYKHKFTLQHDYTPH